MDTGPSCSGTTEVARCVFQLDSGEAHVDTIARSDDEVSRSMCEYLHAVTLMALRRLIMKANLRNPPSDKLIGSRCHGEGSGCAPVREWRSLKPRAG